MTTDIEALASKVEAEAAAAAAKAEQAREKARAAAAEREARRADRLAQYRRQQLDDFDPSVFEDDLLAAQEALREAVLADPVARAYVDLVVAAARRYQAGTAAKSAAVALGDDRQHEIVPGSPPVGGGGLPTQLARIIDAEASRLAEDQRDEAQAELESFMVAADRTGGPA